jgi:hypothetical protein
MYAIMCIKPTPTLVWVRLAGTVSMWVELHKRSVCLFIPPRCQIWSFNLVYTVFFLKPYGLSNADTLYIRILYIRILYIRILLSCEEYTTDDFFGSFRGVCTTIADIPLPSSQAILTT